MNVYRIVWDRCGVGDVTSYVEAPSAADVLVLFDVNVTARMSAKPRLRSLEPLPDFAWIDAPDGGRAGRPWTITPWTKLL